MLKFCKNAILLQGNMAKIESGCLSTDYSFAKAEGQDFLWRNGKTIWNLFQKALKTVGVTGDNLLKMLEFRLDNIVFRLGFAESRAQARQLVNHGFWS